MCALLLQATCVFLTSSVIALIWRKSLFNIQGVQLVRKNVSKRELNDISSTWLSITDFFQNGWVSQRFFFLRGSWKFLRTKLVREPLSAVAPAVWCAFIHDAAESIANYWMVIGPSIVFRISEWGFFSTSLRVYFMQESHGKHMWFWSRYLNISISWKKCNQQCLQWHLYNIWNSNWFHIQVTGMAFGKS